MGELLGFLWDMSVPVLVIILINLVHEYNELRKELAAKQELVTEWRKMAQEWREKALNADNRLDWASDEVGELTDEIYRLRAIIDQDAAPGEIDRLNTEIQRLLCSNQQLTLDLLKINMPKYIFISEA